MSQPIEDYALLGDGRTAALVGLDGSIDWLCLPRFDSPACFAALLGDPGNGRWLLAPADATAVTRRYIGDSAVLETTFTTPTGTVILTDLMPVGDSRADVVRSLRCTEGTATINNEWVVRMDYGRIRPWVHRVDKDGTDLIIAVAGPDKLIFRGPRLPTSADGKHTDEFEMSAGETMTYSVTWVASHLGVPKLMDFEPRIASTIESQQRWADECDYDGPWRDVVVRSLVTLRLLTHEQTGGIVAAPTTSLPEDFGGERNWDYRFCWLRDAALTLEAFLVAGSNSEAKLWRNWLLRAVAGDPEDLQIMYTVDGGRHLPERELPHLAGYAGSKPVRLGNGAVDQRQTDVLGEVMSALDAARAAGLSETDDSWRLQRTLIDGLADHWDEPDNGLWEIRGPQRHFTHSRVMVWVALDRGVRAIEEYGLEGPLERWAGLRDKVRDEVLAQGFDTERNTFTQHYDTDEVDASLLVLSTVGFLDGDDPRILGTIEAVENDLMRDGLLLRYRTQSGVDGLSGDEHPFLACSFWLVSAYAAAGRTDDATALMERLVGLVNDVGLLSEEYDMDHGRMVGNFPQAFSHLTLVNAAAALRSLPGSLPGSRPDSLPG